MSNVETLQLVERLLKVSDHPGIRAKAAKMRLQLGLPMPKVLEKVPGETIVEKAKLLGITRQAWYFWMHGACRPNAARSKQLEKITGFPWRDIKG